MNAKILVVCLMVMAFVCVGANGRHTRQGKILNTLAKLLPLLFQIPASELSRGYGGEDDLKPVQT